MNIWKIFFLFCRLSLHFLCFFCCSEPIYLFIYLSVYLFIYFYSAGNWLMALYMLCKHFATSAMTPTQSFLIHCIPIHKFLMFPPQVLETYSEHNYLCLDIEMLPLNYLLFFQTFRSFIKFCNLFWVDLLFSNVWFWHLCQESDGCRCMDNF
jgi:hypothetical protein